MTSETRRKALLLEMAPMVGGFAALSTTPLVFWSQRRNASTIASGEPLSVSELALWWPILMPLVVALFCFAMSGIGWLVAGRIEIGIGLFFGRGYPVLGFVLWAMGGGGGGSGHDPVSQRAALIYFAVAMVISAVSVVVLAYRTGRQAEAAPAWNGEIGDG